MNNKEEIIEERKGMIVIGMISSGKSTFLNSIFGFNFLQANDNITTKFICIIRYNPKIEEPNFYNLKLIPKKKNSEKYIFIRNGEIYKGKDNIKNQIKSINEKEHKTSEPNYENLFWILEINKIIFENKEFMETHDFYDIPGLNEYMITDKKPKEDKIDKIINKNAKNNKIIDEMAPPPSSINTDELANKINNIQNDKKDIYKVNKTDKEIETSTNITNDENYKYVKGIFKYLKGKIENFIFIISSENCYKPSNLGIIEEVRKNIDFDLENGLFILTKIDLAEDRNKKIEECKQYFINNIPSNIFNLHFNIFVPLNSIDFKIEMFMKEKIKYYFLYFYRRYYEEYIMQTKEINKTFIEYIEEKIKNIIGTQNYDKFIEDAKDNIEMEDLDKIKEEYEEIKSKENKIIEFGIDFEDEDNESVPILKGLYNLWKEKKYLPEFSENTKAIINYFKVYQTSKPKDNKSNIKKSKTNKMDEHLKILENIINEIKFYINEDKNNKYSLTSILSSKMKRLRKYIANGKKIYIPFIGGSSVGKSTILNSLLGYKLFPESQSECTTRGIIIKYGKEVEIYEVKVDSENNFYVFEEGDKAVSKTVENVQDYLKSLNFQYGKDESKYFYLVKTPIKFFDDYKFDEELKKNVLLVDLPGSDTSNNKFNEHDKTDRTVYEKLLEISSSFIFINRGRGITSIENKKVLNQAYNTVIDNTSLGNKFIDHCLFVINIFKKLEEKEKDILTIKRDFYTIIFDDNQQKGKKNNFDLINSSLFDAKSYIEYLNIYNKIGNREKLFKILKEEFITKKKKNFTNFCLSHLKTKCKDLSIELDKNFECDNFFYQDIKKEMTLILNDLNIICKKSDEDNIKKISNILQNVSINIKNNKFYINSNCNEFFNNLKNQIYKAKKNIEKDYENNLENSFYYFDMLFQKEIQYDKTFNQQKFKDKEKEIIEKLDKLDTKYEIKEIFDKYLVKALALIENIRKNYGELIKNYDNKIDELIKVELEEKTHTLLEDSLNKEIEEKMINLDEEIKIIRNKVSDLFYMRLKNEYKKGKYKAEFDFLKNFSFYEKMKIRIYNLFDARSLGKLAVHSFLSSLFIASGFCLSPAGFVILGIYSVVILAFSIYDKNKKELNKKLNEYEEKFQINFTKLRINFSRIYHSSLWETKNKFKELLSISSADLSKIEEQKWINLQKKYQKIKNEIKYENINNN